jgi:hypothetical protein
MSATARWVYVGSAGLTVAGEKNTLRVPSGSTLTCTKLILRQATVLAALAAETIIDAGGTIVVQETVNLGAKLTVNGALQIYGQFIPENYTNSYGLSELVLNSGANIATFGAQDWNQAAKITIYGNFQFFSLGPSQLASLAQNTINLAGGMTFQFGTSLALQSSATIVMTGNTSFLSQDNMSSYKAFIAGKLNNTGGTVNFDLGVDINSTGSYYQQSGSFSAGRDVFLFGLINVTGGAVNTGSFPINVKSGGRFWSNQNSGNPLNLVVESGGQATFASPAVNLNVQAGGVATATASTTIQNLDLAGTFTGSASSTGLSFLRAGGSFVGTLTSTGTVSGNGVFNGASMRLTLQGQSSLKINFGVDRINVQTLDFGTASLDLTGSTSLPTVSGTKWTFASFSSFAGGLTNVILPQGTTNVYSIVFEPAGGPFTSVAVEMTVPPPVAPVPALPPVAPPVAAPPVAAPVAPPMAENPPVDHSAPIAAPVAPVPVAEPVAPAPVAPVDRTLTIGVSSVLNSTQQEDLKSALASTVGGNTADISLSGSGVGQKRSNYVVVATFSRTASSAFDAYFTGNVTQKAVALSTAVRAQPSLASVVDSVVVPTPAPVAAPVAVAAPTSTTNNAPAASPKAGGASEASAQFSASIFVIACGLLMAVL